MLRDSMPQRSKPAAQLRKTIHRQLPMPAAVPAGLPGFPGLAEIAAIVRRWEADDALFCKALESGILPAQALGSLGVRLCLENRNTDAAEVLHAAVALSPDNIEPLNNLAVAMERCDRTEDAIRVVERSLAILTSQPDSWIFLGNLKKRQRDLTGAQLAYEMALLFKSDSALAWQELGLVRKEQREYLPAIECFLNCVRYGQVTPAILSILGQLFFLTGQFQKSRDAYALAVESEATNPLYRQMFREMEFACCAIENQRIDDVINSLPTQDGDDLLHKTFALLSAYGYTEAAARVAEKRVELFPGSATAVYLLHAIQGDDTVARSPNDFLIESFDKVAERFDQHLVNGLGYDIPQKLAAALSGLIPRDCQATVLDAGCGTGLCGPWVRELAASLVGVDLSPKMLEQADRRKIYDRLVCGELTTFLLDSPATFDVIIAADVIIYFGDLSALAAATARSLRRGGLLAFSTERAASPGHHLLASGRFAHEANYIRSVFGTDFIECLCQDTTVRHEANQPVPGNIFVYRRRAASL
jgi:predicted TPR repeat methyltransferase